MASCDRLSYVVKPGLLVDFMRLLDMGGLEECDFGHFFVPIANDTLGIPMLSKRCTTIVSHTLSMWLG